MSAIAPVSVGHAPQPSADATRLLYERHSSRIFGYCLSLLGSREDAEDAVQTTFVNAQRGLSRGVVPKFELAWLFTIARNVCHNSRQSASRRARLEAARDLDALQDVLATPERGGPVQVTELTRALASIPDRQRRALLLREWQGLSYEEIARELDISVAAVETLLFRARRSVAQQLGGTRHANALASLIALLRWLWQGGAPLKVAGAAATFATVTTLAVVPSVRSEAPPRVAPPVMPTSHERPAAGRAPERSGVPPTARIVAKARSSTLPAAPPTQTQLGSEEAPAASLPPAEEPAVTEPTTAPPSSSPDPSSTVSLPAVEVPRVTTPIVELPQVSPPIEVPQVELPVDVPALPPVPSLP